VRENSIGFHSSRATGIVSVPEGRVGMDIAVSKLEPPHFMIGQGSVSCLGLSQLYIGSPSAVGVRSAGLLCDLLGEFVCATAVSSGLCPSLAIRQTIRDAARAEPYERRAVARDPPTLGCATRNMVALGKLSLD
jgi:hypothetical protein